MEGDPWKRLEALEVKTKQKIDPWARLDTLESSPPVDESTMMERVSNRVKNIGSIVKLGGALAIGAPLNSYQERLKKELQTGYDQGYVATKRATSDIGNMFSQATLKGTLKKLMTATGEVLDHPLESAGNGLAMLPKIPMAILDSIIGDTFGAVTGIDISGNEVKALDVDEQTKKTKTLFGNAVAVAVMPAVSKLVSVGFEAPVAAKLGGSITREALEAASTQTLGQIAATKPVLGGLGRALVADVTGDVAAGMAQSAVQNANTPEAISSMAAGLLFAPLGVITGWYRGVKPQRLESAIQAADDIKRLRDWQEVSDAGIEGAALKVTKLLTSDDIAQSVGVLPDVSKVPDIDNLYDAFKSTLNEKDSFASSIAAFAESKGLHDNYNELFAKFSERRTRELVDPAEIKHLEDLNAQFLEDNSRTAFSGFESELADIASRNGFWITNEFGTLKIRDIDTGAVVHTAKSAAEANDLISRMGKPPNVPHMDNGSKAPTNGGPPIVNSPSVTQHPGDHWEPRRPENRQLMSANFDMQLANVSSMTAFVEGMDTLHFDNKLNLKQLHESVEQAVRQTKVEFDKNMSDADIKLIDAFVRSGKRVSKPGEPASLATRIKERSTAKELVLGKDGRFNEEDLTHVGRALEAQTVDEIMAPGGFVVGQTVNPASLQLAQFMKQNNVDHSMVLMYRRSVAGLKGQFSLRTEQAAFENYKKNKQLGVKTVDEINAELNKQTTDMLGSDEFNLELAKLQSKFNATPEFLAAATKYDELFDTPNGTLHATAASRLKIALDEPDGLGLSRQDYITKHNLSSDQVRLLGMVEGAYKKFGTKFGIKDERMFLRYMNHYRQFGDILDTNTISDFERGITDPGMRQFASAMIRTGEIANYNQNPVSNLYSYIRAGTKSKHLYPTLDSEFGAKGRINDEISKIESSQLRTMVKERFENYQRDVTGQMTMGETQLKHAQAQYLKSLRFGDKPMTTQEIIAEMQRPDMVDTALSLSSAGLLGGRISLAFRDNVDVYQKYFVRHGREKLTSMLRRKVTDKDRQALIDAGEITNPTSADVYNPGGGIGQATTIGKAAQELAEFGYKTSLQGHFYMKNQAAVYMETYETALKEFDSLERFKSTKEAKQKVYDNLFLNAYDPSTQRMVNAYVEDGQYNSAARLLAKQEVRATVGSFSRGNQPPVASSKLGKMFGQMGSWAMANRSVFQNMMTRGTEAEMRRSYIRYGTTVVAGGLAGAATGLNLGSWLLLPTSFVTVGGPVLQSMGNVANLARSELGGNEAQAQFNRREASRSLMMFVPGSNMVRDVGKGMDLFANSDGFGVMRPLARTLGVGVNTEDRNLLDIVMGNNPIKWPEP